MVDGKAMVDSRDIAAMFGKEHRDVLRAIGSSAEAEQKHYGNARKIARVEYTDNKGEKRPCYRLTYRGFLQVAMGFTGEKGTQKRPQDETGAFAE